jgi:hypothetical protein
MTDPRVSVVTIPLESPDGILTIGRNEFDQRLRNELCWCAFENR